MSKSLKIILCITFGLILLFSLSSCENKDSYHDRYETGYIDGERDGFDDGYDEGHWEGYKEGFGEAYYRFEEIALHDAVRYAEEYGGWHPEEAMEIIDAYENDELAFGKMSVTEEDYKKAVKSLYWYYEYFYDGLYYEKMDMYN